jgi:hypothetical protein
MVSDVKMTEERTDADLRAWDWRAELRAQERSVPWLARRTNRSDQMVYKYALGRLPTPIAWLRDAARVLGYA